ncbi:hypothetical protein L211DRAFT_840491 [Terfezia boudieri ATCC MYA-4762]|uniref:Uncharacterized protein n=1 Tax=Terfezia boudieri ATCC MYA-4762 TaxID=1051890 RepID=A0A3N4LFB5_9PEZI|nr:hypothetical protein L211DRAFT_840491 [Terfezia boudieri ATCC MYA-4762]
MYARFLLEVIRHELEFSLYTPLITSFLLPVTTLFWMTHFDSHVYQPLTFFYFVSYSTCFDRQALVRPLGVI